jgi:hypothetical protein
LAARRWLGYNGREIIVTKFVAVLLLLLLFVPAFSTPSAARQLYYDLKGITAITYNAVSGQDSKSCRVERESLDTALQFVANQSVKLKLIPSREHDIRYQELNETQNKFGNNSLMTANQRPCLPRWKMPSSKLRGMRRSTTA